MTPSHPWAQYLPAIQRLNSAVYALQHYHLTGEMPAMTLSRNLNTLNILMGYRVEGAVDALTGRPWSAPQPTEVVPCLEALYRDEGERYRKGRQLTGTSPGKTRAPVVNRLNRERPCVGVTVSSVLIDEKEDGPSTAENLRAVQAAMARSLAGLRPRWAVHYGSVMAFANPDGVQRLRLH